MNLNEANRWLWLWLLERGSHWTAQEIAQRTGYGSQNIFRALHHMARRQLVEQLDPRPGEHRKRYGVTQDCLVPLGLRVGEVTQPGTYSGAELPAVKRQSIPAGDASDTVVFRTATPLPPLPRFVTESPPCRSFAERTLTAEFTA